jgi:hypothetical protein
MLGQQILSFSFFMSEVVSSCLSRRRAVDATWGYFKLGRGLSTCDHDSSNVKL